MPIICFEVKNLVFWTRSQILGFVFDKQAAPNPKHEILIPKQSQMTKIRMTQTTTPGKFVHMAMF